MTRYQRQWGQKLPRERPKQWPTSAVANRDWELFRDHVLEGFDVWDLSQKYSLSISSVWHRLREADAWAQQTIRRR